MTSKKHKPWHRELCAYWQNKGVIERCEVQFKGCFGTYGLSPAHSKDRRDIHSREDFFEVVAACENCHRILDHKMSKVDRLVAVKDLIEKREQIEQSAA